MSGPSASVASSTSKDQGNDAERIASESISSADTAPVDAFILYNIREPLVDAIVDQLQQRGVSTHFWARDVKYGEDWVQFEDERLAGARAVLLLLGTQGWGPTQLRITRQAFESKKLIIPVVVGELSPTALSELDGYFKDHRYVDYRKPGALDEIVKAIRDPALYVTTSSRPPDKGAEDVSSDASPPWLDELVASVVDGSEETRAEVLRHIQTTSPDTRSVIGQRLREEFAARFGDGEALAKSTRELASLRSWLLSCIIWANPGGPDNVSLALQHVSTSGEPDRNVRFWTLANLYQAGSPGLATALKTISSDDAPDVALLAQAISANGRGLEDDFRARLASTDFNHAWPVLRVLRIVPIKDLVPVVCRVFAEADAGTRPSYTSLYVLAHPVMADAAASILTKSPGIGETVRRVASAVSGALHASRTYANLLAAFEPKAVDVALEGVASDPNLATYCGQVRKDLDLARAERRGEGTVVAGFAADVIDVARDPLDIREDVETLTAIMLARDLKPPLAIGLYGDWGTGKSYFMKSMKAAGDRLVHRSRGAGGRSAFCSNVVAVEFNAWHFADTNLWASLVSYILERLAEHVMPQATPEEQRKLLDSELTSAQTALNAAKAEREQAQLQIRKRQAEVERLQAERHAKELRLRDLRLPDLATLLKGNDEVRELVSRSLDEVGVPALSASAAEFSQAVAEAASLRGRVAAVALALFRGKNWVFLIILTLLALVVGPLVSWAFHGEAHNDFIVKLASISSQFAAAIAGATFVLRNAIKTVEKGIGGLQTARQKVDEMIAKRREAPTQEERKLADEIAGLRGEEQGVVARMNAAAARVTELEARIRALTDERSLARFLVDRTQSDDYRKHLGLISTIRRDFEALAKRLAEPSDAAGGTPRVERIVLYIDDLDRCPPDKVMEVLQAIHLLLAYPLFVVVVGVDPRWLLHSLTTSLSPFRSDRADDDADADAPRWRTTPQNYLEKIFQIPFSLRPMTSDGYGRLMGQLFATGDEPVTEFASAPPPDVNARRDGAAAHGAPTVAPAGVQDNSKPQTPNAAPSPGPSAQPTMSNAGDQAATPSETTGTQRAPDHDVAATEFVVQERSLVIRPWEARFADELFPLMPTPRAAKRFSNIYRILKARIPARQLATFEGVKDVPGEFQVPMFLLALVIGMPAQSALLLPALYRRAMAGRNLADAFAESAQFGFDTADAAPLLIAARHIVTAETFPRRAALSAEWIPRVARFSFDGARALGAIASEAAEKE